MNHEPTEDLQVTLDHVRLDVADLERSTKFYEEALGLSTVVTYPIEGGAIRLLAHRGGRPGIELWAHDGLVVSPHQTHHVAFRVNDVRAAVDRVTTHGARIVEPIHSIGEESVAVVTDPDGHVIELNDFRGRPGT